MRQAAGRIPRAAYALLIVTAACAGLLHDAVMLASQLVLAVSRPAAAKAWPSDPAEATVPFYQEMVDLHEAIIDILYPPDREIDQAENEKIRCNSSPPAAPLAATPANVPKRSMAQEASSVPQIERSRVIVLERVP